MYVVAVVAVVAPVVVVRHVVSIQSVNRSGTDVGIRSLKGTGIREGRPTGILRLIPWGGILLSMQTTTITVQGMTCDHCVRAVTDEVRTLPGVVGVAVDLASGRVEISSDHALQADAIEAAVEEAGYTLL